MEGGEMRNEAGISWNSDPSSGIIPRALAQIFGTLMEQADRLEYSIRVSSLELYNEEIFDLLSAHDDTSRLRLYKDATRKGSVIIQVG
jgi:kinesin family protein 11